MSLVVAHAVAVALVVSIITNQMEHVQKLDGVGALGADPLRPPTSQIQPI